MVIKLTIDEDISPGGVGAGIADQVYIGSFQLLGVSVAAHGNHGFPQILDFLVDEVGKTGIDVARRNAVDAGKVSPLVGQRSGEMDTSSLGDIVRGLFLGEIGNVTGHGRGDDQASGAALFEVVADSLGAVEGTGQIGLDDFVPVFNGAVQDAGIGGSASIGDEAIDLAEVLDDVLDELIDAVIGADVAFVRLGLDAVGFLELFGVLLASFRAGSIGDGNIGTQLSTATGSLNAHAFGARGTGDNDDLALQAEKVHEVVSLGNFDRHDCGCFELMGERVERCREEVVRGR